MTEAVVPHFQTAWRLFRARPGVFLVSMLLLFASWVALEVAVVVLYRFGFLFRLLLHLAWLFLFSGMMVGLHRIAFKVLDDQAPRVSDLFASLHCGPAFLLAFGIYVIAVVSGLALLIVPGVFLAVRYALFAQVLARGSGFAFQALRDAATLSSGRWPAVGVFFLLALLLNLAGAAFLGLGLLVAFPVSVLATADLYRSLQRSAV